VLLASAAWLVLLVASFICYKRIDAFADFAGFDLGRLPSEVIWFGAAGGWLISAQGIFLHNQEWDVSYDYWHYVRPVVGALMGTLGCLVFVVLNDAATAQRVAVSPVFYNVLALAIGYREESFRALIAKLFDTIILPGEKEGAGGASASTSPAAGTRPDAPSGDVAGAATA
jgi:hypothetical protein